MIKYKLLDENESNKMPDTIIIMIDVDDYNNKLDHATNLFKSKGYDDVDVGLGGIPISFLYFVGDDGNLHYGTTDPIIEFKNTKYIDLFEYVLEDTDWYISYGDFFTLKSIILSYKNAKRKYVDIESHNYYSSDEGVLEIYESIIDLIDKLPEYDTTIFSRRCTDKYNYLYTHYDTIISKGYCIENIIPPKQYPNDSKITFIISGKIGNDIKSIFESYIQEPWVLENITDSNDKVSISCIVNSNNINKYYDILINMITKMPDLIGE